MRVIRVSLVEKRWRNCECANYRVLLARGTTFRGILLFRREMLYACTLFVPYGGLYGVIVFVAVDSVPFLPPRCYASGTTDYYGIA